MNADQVVARFEEAFGREDVDAVMAAMTEDCVFDDTTPPDGGKHVGQAAVRAAWEQFFSQTQGAHFTQETRTVFDDKVIVQWRFDWSGEEPGHIRGVDIFTVRDDLVASKEVYVKG